MIIKRCAAEFLGTFMIVFAPIAASASQASLAIAAAVSGLAVLAMIYTFGPISSAHFNPAVTLAFAATKRFPWREAGHYVGCQVAGGLVAALVGAVLFGPGFGAHFPTGQSLIQPIGIEFILSFLLMTVITAVATDKRVHSTVPALAIGLTVVVCVLVGGPFTGGSMNPARSFGPSLFNPKAVGSIWLYLVVPPLGAIAAALLFDRVRLDSEPNLLQSSENV